MLTAGDETNVSAIMQSHYKSRALKTISSLEKNDISAEYAADRNEALEKVIAAIPENATIGIGDSATLHQIGLFKWLEKAQHQIFNPFIWDSEGHFVYPPVEQYDILRKALISDVYLTGSNAITLDGKIVSIDGKGNRVAAMLFGPKKVILVIGANKIVNNLEEAMARLKIAAAMNAKRHMQKHGQQSLHLGIDKLPCFATGICGDCKSHHKMCRKTVIIDGQSRDALSPEESGIHVILVGESLGL
jgi:hypothetical protein